MFGGVITSADMVRLEVERGRDIDAPRLFSSNPFTSSLPKHFP
jgi:hypothetical protein